MSRPRGGSIDPPVGGQYISTSNKWTEHEINVMKKIHSAYLRSLDVEEIQRLQDGGTKNDTEFFLPKDCSLRSDKGELLKPLWGGRGPFESQEEFISSTLFAYWITQTATTLNIDEMMNDWAKTIIKDICNEQSKDLRDKGSQTFGLGSNQKREHVTPLALVLHDLKLWSVQVLRNAKTVDKDTFMEIGRRIKFLTYIIPKDVWSVGSKLNPFGKGLTREAYNALSNVLQKVIQTLREANDYCFRRYMQHMCFGKISTIIQLMHSQVSDVARFASAVSTIDEVVLGARDRQLRYTDLLEPSVIQSHSDWTVLANVCLRYCFKDKFARASLTSDFSQFDIEKHGALVLKTWLATNPFICRNKPTGQPQEAAKQQPAPPAGAPAVSEPILGEVLEDAKVPGLASCYQACLDSLQKEMTEGSSMFGSAVAKHVRLPLTKDKQLANLKRAFPVDAERIRMLRALFKVIGSLRDTIPAFFVLIEYSKITTDDKRVMVDSILRGELIRALAEVNLRFAFVLAAVKHLGEEMAELAGSALAAQGKMDEAAQLLLNGPGVRRETSQKVAVTNRKGSVVGTRKPAQELDDPIFVRNLDMAFLELMPSIHTGAKSLFKTANELASELYHFVPLVSRQIETPEERACVTYCDLLVRIRGDDFSGTSFLLSRIAPKKEYLNLPHKKLQEAFKFATEDCAFQLEPNSMAFSTFCVVLDQELQNSLKPSAHDDHEEDAAALDQLDAMGESESTTGKSETSAARRAASSISSAITKPLKSISSSKQATAELAVRMENDDNASTVEHGSAGTKKSTKKRLSIFGKKLF